MSHAKPLLSYALMRWRVFWSGTEHQIEGGIECRLWRGAARLGATDHSRGEREPGLGLRPDRGRHGQSRVSKVLLIGERSLRLALSEYVAHYHAERNHQGKDNVLLFPRDTQTRRGGPVQCRERLGELLHYYHQEAA